VDLNFAAGVQVEQRSRSGGVLRSILDVDLALGVQVGVQNVRLLSAGQVDPNDTLLKAGLQHSLLGQHLSLQE
jgi:hypothetical protein